MLLRARAAEAAVWVLSDPHFLEDACRLLVGLVKLGTTAGGTEAGFGLCRRLRLFVLQLSPAVVAVRCLRGNVGPPEVSYLNLALWFRVRLRSDTASPAWHIQKHQNNFSSSYR